MAFTDLFIRRPVFAIVINLLILLAGIQSIRSLNVRQYPKSDIAVVNVKTRYIGANADLVRGFVTTPLERSIASADGIDFIESQSAQNLSIITVHLKLNYDTNAALTQIQSKVAQVRNDLPPESESPTIELTTSDNQFASMYLSFYTEDLDPNQITDYLTRVIQPKLTAVSGVQKAEILGARTFAMRIWLKPAQMAALNVSASEVRRALSANNYLSALGGTRGSDIVVNLVANTNLTTADEFKEMVIREDQGRVVRLKQIADVSLGAEDYDSDVRFSGQTATFMGIWVLPTANSLDVMKRVRAEMPYIERQLPSGMKAGIPYDSTRYIDDALKEVLRTLTETLIIVVAVIFLFLGSVRSVLIPIVAIPVSLVGAAFIMLVFGFTLNLLTLLAIVLSVGLVVDDAIVVVENVERHIREGSSPLEAALKGARELLGPIVAMTITLAAVYAPVGLQGGLTGTLFREFVFTLAGAVIVSGIVAITLSPVMSGHLLKPATGTGGFAGVVNRFFDRVKSSYGNVLRSSLRWRPVTLFFAVAFTLLGVPFYLLSGKELAPKEDQGVVFGIVQAAPNSTIDQTTRYTALLNDLFLSIPETATTFQITQPFQGFSGLVTKPWSQRARSTDQILGEVFGRSAGIPGIRVIATTPAPLPGASNLPVEFVICTTAEPRELVGFAEQLVGKALKSGMFMFADTDLKFDLPQAEVVLDRDLVFDMGLNLQQIGGDLSAMLGGAFVNRFSIQGRSYKVIPQLERAARLNPEQVSDIYVPGPEGRQIQLSTIASVRKTVEPRTLNRFQQLNCARIQGAYPPNVTLDSVLRFLETEASTLLPRGYSVDYQGEARQLRVEGSRLNETLLVSMILIFLVLAAQFESFRSPFIILLGSVPLALTGALMFSFLGFTTLNIYSQVGLITLVGLVSKNGILIVEFANHLRDRGVPLLEAIVEAGTTRLRPILMTSVATVVGHFPLVLASGPGAGARNSIGVVLVSGMIIGTLLTLFVIPAIYIALSPERRTASA
jgi:multidrug efflux pump